MKKDIYNNRAYWLGLHKSFSGSLRSVGWPDLSEEFNVLKYKSESEAFYHSISLSMSGKRSASVLEIGAGIGFWTNLTLAFAAQNKIQLDLSVLDISPEALDLIRNRFPDVTCIHSDLTSIKKSVIKKYDIVTAIMVLLHLTDFDEYLKALNFCAASVRGGGHLIIYEPLLLRNYSPFISNKFNQFKGNSVTHVKFQIDNILSNLGFKEVAMMSGSSWLLNSPIQSGSKYEFLLKKYIWKFLARSFFKSDKLTRAIGYVFSSIDSLLKRKNGDSGSFVVYLKHGE
jgi:SAM-dependent methyltransferase